MTRNPISARSRSGATIRSLSLSLTDTKTVPEVGNGWPDAELALAEGDREIAVDAHDLARRAHLGTEDGIDAGEASEREHGLLHGDMVELGGPQAEARQRLAGHDLGRNRSHRLADHLGDERHGARGTRVDFEDVHGAILDRELHIHQPDDFQGQREFPCLTLDFGDQLRLQRMRRQRAGAIAGVDARLLDVLHDAGDERVLAVGEAIDVDLDGIRQDSGRSSSGRLSETTSSDGLSSVAATAPRNGRSRSRRGRFPWRGRRARTMGGSPPDSRSARRPPRASPRIARDAAFGLT